MNQPQLTPEQRDILTRAANGHTTKAIGQAYGLNERSTYRHLAVIRDLLGARDRTHAVALALLAGLLDADEIKRPVAGAA